MNPLPHLSKNYGIIFDKNSHNLKIVSPKEVDDGFIITHRPFNFSIRGDIDFFGKIEKITYSKYIAEEIVEYLCKEFGFFPHTYRKILQRKSKERKKIFVRKNKNSLEGSIVGPGIQITQKNGVWDLTPIKPFFMKKNKWVGYLPFSLREQLKKLLNGRTERGVFKWADFIFPIPSSISFKAQFQGKSYREKLEHFYLKFKPLEPIPQYDQGVVVHSKKLLSLPEYILKNSHISPVKGEIYHIEGKWDEEWSLFYVNSLKK